MKPTDPIVEHFRLTAEQRSALRRLSITTIRDLLYHFPARYDVPGSHGTVRVKVMWFNQPYLAKMVPQNVMVKLTGTVAGKDRPYITNPEIELLSSTAMPEPLFSQDASSDTSLFPVYPESRGITSRWMYHALKKVFESNALAQLEDPIPEHIREKYHLPDVKTAFIWVHTPKTQRDSETARKRFSFEEIFVIQVARRLERAENDKNTAFTITVDRTRVQKFVSTLPFPPTNAQKRAVEDILSDFEKPHPMARLLEGDVGSGKTAVAAITAYAAVTSRPVGRTSGTLQVAYMAPTEILATQHFQSFIQFFKELPINIALITGSGCYKFPSKLDRDKPTPISRAQLLKWVASGEIAMLVGTHALIQKAVKFSHLAYAIVDEQHRFGTAQRKQLAHKGDAPPHFLSMTATPIPRTLALTLYGDLDLSVLDELPLGRAGVETTIVAKDQRGRAYEATRVQLQHGRQAYVICPRIDEPDPEKELALIAKSAKAEALRLQKEIFPEFTVGLLHGKMNQKEKDDAMREFANGETHVLVATSVVEVGVNVPNATVMLIEGAERFGLAQLHQLRGRILRSAHTALCFLLPQSGSSTNERLKAITKTRDGFALAEEDLRLRGAGDLYGRAQWGMSDLGMEALKNPRLIEAAREAAHMVVKNELGVALRERLAWVTERLHNE